MKTPMPHQRQALREIVPAAKKHPRFTTIMPCGTGKTMVQLWMAEALKPMTVLVLLPSLSLLRQTLHEWMAETKWKNFEVLCVCSDQTVGQHREDEVQISPEEIGYPVTSDSAEIAAFLSKKVSGVKLIFSTYHSSPLVAVGMGKNFWLDLGIFDEAHVTAGEEDGLFSFALEDKNLRIRKRSFWTATPRHYDLSRYSEEVDLPVVYSMDDKDIYGPVVHKLTFRKAVEQGIICDYEVLVSVVSNTMLGVNSIDEGEVLVKGTRVPARLVAHHVALNKAIDGFGITKIFSFHPRVHDAEEFTNGGPQSAVHHIPKDFKLFHVNGDMTTALREEKLGVFRRSKRALMSNARCLTQGIDVPAVDLVAFFSKKRSLIDIVQATGRAMRRAPGKTKGYILIPLYVQQEEGETLEQAVERSDFREVWAVLNAMREQDEALAETMSRIRIKRGDDDGPSVNPPGGTIIDTIPDVPITVIGPRVNIKNLRRAITTICIDRLTPSWDEMYGRLLAFKRRYGHCKVIQNWQENPRLGHWVSTQRALYEADKLSRDRINRLNAIGFIWRVIDLYDTLAEASAAAQALKIPNERAYREAYKKDPLLPRHPDLTYADEWVDNGRWNGFLGYDRPRKRRIKKESLYSTVVQASKAARKLGIKARSEYDQKRKTDPRLPSSPHRFYSSSWKQFGGWVGFLGNDKRDTPYSTYEEAAKAAKAFGWKTPKEYSQNYQKDPKLRCHPNRLYEKIWEARGGWNGFLGR